VQICRLTTVINSGKSVAFRSYILSYSICLLTSTPPLHNDCSKDCGKFFSFVSISHRTDLTDPSAAQKAPFPRAAKRQNSSKIRVTKMSPQILILPRSTTNEHQFFAEKQVFFENFQQSCLTKKKFLTVQYELCRIIDVVELKLCSVTVLNGKCRFGEECLT
jgi:hypothetical protein